MLSTLNHVLGTRRITYHTPNLDKTQFTIKRTVVFGDAGCENQSRAARECRAHDGSQEELGQGRGAHFAEERNGDNVGAGVTLLNAQAGDAEREPGAVHPDVDFLTETPPARLAADGKRLD